MSDISVNLVFRFWGDYPLCMGHISFLCAIMNQCIKEFLSQNSRKYFKITKQVIDRYVDYQCIRAELYCFMMPNFLIFRLLEMIALTIGRAP